MNHVGFMIVNPTWFATLEDSKPGSVSDNHPSKPSTLVSGKLPVEQSRSSARNDQI